MAHVSKLNEQLGRYVLRFLAADALDAEPMSPQAERTLAEQVAHIADNMRGTGRTASTPWRPGAPRAAASERRTAVNGPTMGKHRRHEADVLLAVQQYEQLMLALQVHQPGKRSGLCAVCGTGWPCAEVWLPLARGRMSGELQ